MRCPECGDPATDDRLKYCENCGAKMPVSPQAPGPRPAPRASRPKREASEPAYAEEILEEVEAHSRPSPARPSPARPSPVREAPALGAEDVEDKTDVERSRPAYDGPKWLAHVPAHSPTVAGVGLMAVALVLGILPFFSGPGVLGALLALVAGGVLVARELREVGEAPGFTERLPKVLLRSEAAALSTVVLAAVAVRTLGLGLTPLLWLAGAGLVVHSQWRKVIVGEDGVAHLFEPRQLLLMPRLMALVGVAVCLLSLFTPWVSVQPDLPTIPDNAPVPMTPPELRVIPSQQPSEDLLYGNTGHVTLSGWDMPASVVAELALLAVLALLALRPEVARPAWARFVPAGSVGLVLVWAAVNLSLLAGPLAFLVGLALVGVLAVRELRDGSAEPPPPDVDESEQQ